MCQCQTGADCARYPKTHCDGCACVAGEFLSTWGTQGTLVHKYLI